MNQPSTTVTRTRTRVQGEQASLPGETGKQTVEAGGVGAARAVVRHLEGHRGRLVITAGKQLLSPIQFQSFEVAPLELAIDLEAGDDVEAIAAEALELLRGIQNEEFKHALAMHRKLVVDAEQAVGKKK